MPSLVLYFHDMLYFYSLHTVQFSNNFNKDPVEEVHAQ